MLDLKSELSAWCASYVAAFSAYDLAGIAAHWNFPALIIQADRTIAFKSGEHFSKNTGALLSFYKRQGVVRADRTLINAMEMNAHTASMRVRDVMVGTEGDEIVTWEAAYVLQKMAGKWRAVCAAADGEVAAWNARGTPLGS